MIRKRIPINGRPHAVIVSTDDSCDGCAFDGDCSGITPPCNGFIFREILDEQVKIEALAFEAAALLLALSPKATRGYKVASRLLDALKFEIWDSNEGIWEGATS